MRTHGLLAGLLLLGACNRGPTDERYVLRWDGATTPRRTGDAMRVNARLERQVQADGAWETVALCDDDQEEFPFDCQETYINTEPRVIDAEGLEVTVEPIVDRFGEATAYTLQAPGVYEIIGITELPEDVRFVQPRTFEIVEWGSPETSMLTALEGKTYALVDYDTWPLDISDLLQDNHPPLGIEITDVTDTGATVTAFSRELEQDCVLLRAEGSFEADGWSWSIDQIYASEEVTGQILAEDVWLTVSWNPDDPDVADMRGHARVDTRSLAPLIDPDGDPDGPCELLLAFGTECIPCDNGESYCIDLNGHQGRLVDAPDLDTTDMPVCGVDLSDFQLAEPITCDPIEIDIGCANTGRRVGVGLLLVAMMVLRRRRRAAG